MAAQVGYALFFSSRLDILIHGIYGTMRLVCIIIVAIVLG
jgi:hypothetical protein